MSCLRCRTWPRQKQRHPQTLGLLMLSIKCTKLRPGWLVCRLAIQAVAVWVMMTMMNLFKAHQMLMTTSSVWRAVCEGCMRWKPTRRRKMSSSWAARARLLPCQLRTPATRGQDLLQSRTARTSNASRHSAIASRSTILVRVSAGLLPVRPTQPPQPRVPIAA